jgi:hypothetical protein
MRAIWRESPIISGVSEGKLRNRVSNMFTGAPISAAVVRPRKASKSSVILVLLFPGIGNFFWEHCLHCFYVPAVILGTATELSDFIYNSILPHRAALRSGPSVSEFPRSPTSFCSSRLSAMKHFTFRRLRCAPEKAPSAPSHLNCKKVRDIYRSYLFRKAGVSLSISNRYYHQRFSLKL